MIHLDRTPILHHSTTPSRRWLVALRLGLALLATSATAAEEPFRPEAGKFPPLEKAHIYRGELVFVDHANRRGSLRVTSPGIFRFTAPHPFALLPYALVRYHGAPADLRDIPLGTMLHVRAFIPPDPKTSAVPVLPVNNREKTKAGALGVAPAENHVLLLEDEPSYCQREGLVWKFKEMEIKDRAGTILASREGKENAKTKPGDETLTFDAATRVWRGRECLRIEHLIAEGTWPGDGKKALGGQSVQIGIRPPLSPFRIPPMTPPAKSKFLSERRKRCLPTAREGTKSQRMNPTQKQFSLNRGAFRKQIPAIGIS